MLATSRPEQLWDVVVTKRFDADTDAWTVEGLDGDEDECYRITVRHNNHADQRDNLRLMLNGDGNKEHHEGVEGYISAVYTPGTDPSSTGWHGGPQLSTGSGSEYDASHLVGSRSDCSIRLASHPFTRNPLHELWETSSRRQRCLRPGTHGCRKRRSALLDPQVRETHPKGHLLTIGRYTYTNTEDTVTKLAFSSGRAGGIGSGSRITVERFTPGRDE